MSNSTQEKRKRRRGKQGDSKVLIALEEGDPWWEVASSTQGRNDVITDKNNNNNKSVETSTVIKYRKRADELFELELTAFHNRDGTNKLRDDRWMDETMRKGTLQDRIAAMAVSCSQNPVHKLNVLDQLLSLASKEKRIATMSSEALQNLFVDVYLPPERKLILLSRRPLNDYENNSSKKTLSPRVLMLWRFEELVKERYSRFLSLLATWLNDAAGSIDVHKLNAIRTTVELLSARPEAEAQLLSMAVNKLGDPMKKAAAAAGHQLRILLESHPAMTPVVAREVQQLAHRPHLSPKALYNCVIFLNQLKLTLSQDANSLPTSLIKTYFRLFEVAIDRGDKHSSSKKVKHTPEAGKMRGRLLSALLTGVNRAHPFLPKSDEGMIEHVDALYRISHNSPPAAATQALMLLFQLAIGNGNLTEDGEASNQVHLSRKNRFYRVLYSKLGDPAIFVGRQTTMFFNLLYKAMKSDNNAARILAFAKNLLLSASHTSPGVLCASLFLVSEIMRVHPSLKESELQNVFTDFDVTKRDPDAALGPHKTGSLWEASLLSYHFHPSVSKFCGSLGDIKYNGDPCKDFSLAPFLDRFAYRNPKSKDRESKLKLGQSIAKRKDLAVDDRMAIPVNDPKFLDASNISEMDVFFHKYFTRRSKLDAWKGIERVANSTNGDKPVNYGSDSDPEEAEFAYQLAEKLMDDAAGGKSHYDDEDPDTKGWEDLKDDINGYDNVEGSSDNVDFSAMDGFAEGDDDNFMEEDGVSDFDSDDNGEIGLIGSFEDDTDDELESEEEMRSKSTSSKKKNKTKDNPSAFEDASKYEEMINKSWSGYTESKSATSGSVEEEVRYNQKMKKKKRKKSHK